MKLLDVILWAALILMFLIMIGIVAALPWIHLLKGILWTL